MIILSGVLVVLAIALLVAGIVAGADGVGGIEGLTLIYVSIGISVVSALCLLIGVFLRRKELFGPTGAVVPARGTKGTKPGRAARKAQQAKLARETPGFQAPGETGGFGEAGAASQAEPFEDALGVPTQPVDVPPDAVVLVVRGRKRYHLESCRQLAGREKEELTYEEAIEEGFSPCTACLPDTALAARAAVSVGEPGLAAEATSEIGETGTPTAIPPAEGFGLPAAGSGYSPYGSYSLESLSGPRRGERPVTEPERDRAAADPLSGGYGVPAATSAFGAAQPTIPSRWEVGERDERPAPPADRQTRQDIPVVQAAASSSGAFAPPKPATPEDAPTPDGAEGAEDVEKADDHDRPSDAQEPEGAHESAAGWEPDEAGAGQSGDDDRPEAGSAPATQEFDVIRAEPRSPEPEDDAAEPAPDEQEPEDVAPDEDGGKPAEQDAEEKAPLVRILSGTKRYHRPDCALIEDIGDEAEDLDVLTRDEAKAKGCTPCLVCQPDKDTPTD